MLILTAKLKSWLQEHKGLSADEASEDEYREAAGKAIVDGSLDTKTLGELTQDEDAPKASKFEKTLESILSAVGDQAKRLEALERKPEKSPEAPEPEKEVKLSDKAPEFDSRKALGQGIAAAEPGSAPQVDHKPAHKQYDGTRRELRYPAQKSHGAHPLAGQLVGEGTNFSTPEGLPVGMGRRSIDEPSQLDKAVAGAWTKYQLWAGTGGTGQGIHPVLRMTDHDHELVKYAMNEMPWAGELSGGREVVNGTKLTQMQQKALLDDATSNGLEIAPIAFDDQVILTPLLNGEFFPMVNVVNIARGRRIEGALLANVTITSAGQGEGTAIALFNTASFVTAFDTTIFVADGAIEIGLDFLSDSPVDVGSIITQQYGQQLLTWLDTQIVGGDGTTEPEGILNATGTTTVSSANGAGGGPTVGDYEGLLFGVDKAHKQGHAANRIAYGANETTYRRARGIAVGTTDARRVFGMDHEDYRILGHPYGISESFTNPQIIFANFARYRLYRRMGLNVRVTTEGRTLVRSNFMMISIRARYGGQLETGSAAAVMTDAQS